MSSQPCLADTDCTHLDIDGDGNLSVEIIISSDDGNTVECRPNGLFGSQAPVPESVTLPSSPSDGQMFVYEFDPMTQWLFRYDADESSSYKWKYVGGTPAYAREDTDLVLVAPDGTWANGSPALGLTLPFAGFYMARYGAFINPAEDGKLARVGVEENGTDPTFWAGESNVRGSSPCAENPVPNDGVSPIALPGTIVRLQRAAAAHDGADDVHINHRWMAVWPVKVGP